MSYVQPTNNCCLNPIFDQHQWILQIRRAFDEEYGDDNNFYVSIFNVPKALRATNPDAYTPQLVALGPYHYRRPELHEMERYKLSSAKRIQNQNRNMKFQSIVDHFIMLEPKIRACYHIYLDISGETLAWMMAIDASFLLEVIDIYAIKEGKVLTRVSSRMSHLVDYAKRKSAHNAILRDITMLENQIPFFVLRKLSEFQFSSLDLADETLSSALIGLCKGLSPFKIVEDETRIQLCKYEHLLDFLYHYIVPKLEENIEVGEPVIQEANKERKVYKLVLELKECLGRIPFKTIFTLPWMFISNLPGFAVLKALFFIRDNHQENLNSGISSRSDQCNKPPLIEEIMIPSIVELSKSGVTFMPTDGGIMSISFDSKNKKFYLPVINLDDNSEVLLRNLVAYEASSALGPLVFTRYTELMNGIIDTKDDAILLRERGVILNYLKSDEAVVNLWNGMSKSLRLTRVPFLDEIIENVNKYYDGNWKVRVGKIIKVYIINSWQFLVFLAIVLVLFLLMLQIFSYISYCSRMVGSHAR